jgi:hypothetical protein
MQPRSIYSDPVRLGFLTLTAPLLIQMFHESEHVMQIVQKYAWHWRTFPGVLGRWFDFEWIHFLYNGALWIALLAAWIIYSRNPGIWRASARAASALKFVVYFQAYHWLEHWVRMVQYYIGILKPPGIAGQFISTVELHFLFGTIVTIAMLVAYVGFRPWSVLRIQVWFDFGSSNDEQAAHITH